MQLNCEINDLLETQWEEIISGYVYSSLPNDGSSVFKKKRGGLQFRNL